MKNKTTGRLDSWQGQEMFLFSKKKHPDNSETHSVSYSVGIGGTAAGA